MVSDKTIHKAFRTHTTINKPIREIFHFYCLPKLYIGFNMYEYITVLGIQFALISCCYVRQTSASFQIVKNLC